MSRPPGNLGSRWPVRLVAGAVFTDRKTCRGTLFPNGGAFWKMLQRTNGGSTLPGNAGSISIIGDKDPTAFVKSQFELYNGMARKFGYIQ